MQLTISTDYSLYVQTHLGVQNRQPATIQEITCRYGIANGHPTKVVPIRT